VERAKLYSAPDGSELSMVFQFEHMCLDSTTWEKWDFAPLPLVKLKECYRRWQQELQGQGWNSLFMNNHDLPRIVSRWGDDKVYRVESAKMLATMLHGMQGTPYIFQGEELGMTNIKLPLEAYVDVEIHNLFRDRTAMGYSPEAVMESIWKRGRDNARTPMQWTAGANAGFTDGKPWLTVNPNKDIINAEAALSDPDSVFYYYQKLIAIRKSHDVIRSGSFTLLCPEDEQVFAYTRDTEKGHLLVVCNFTAGEAAFAMPEAFEKARCLIGNYPALGDQLKPYQAAMFYYED
jgi:glucan 1,6-alpha-glucosidase